MQTAQIRGGTPVNVPGEQQEITDPEFLAWLEEIGQWNRQRAAEREEADIRANQAVYQAPPDILSPDRPPDTPPGGLPSPAASPPHPYLQNHPPTPPPPAADNTSRVPHLLRHAQDGSDRDILNPFPTLPPNLRNDEFRDDVFRNDIPLSQYSTTIALEGPSTTDPSSTDPSTTDPPSILNNDKVKNFIRRSFVGVGSFRLAWSKHSTRAQASRKIKGCTACESRFPHSFKFPNGSRESKASTKQQDTDSHQDTSGCQDTQGHQDTKAHQDTESHQDTRNHKDPEGA
ncbi:MAG: hypothetical protein Q9220_007617 [cf. Caloplaca sp. 1 TL-2023]